MNVVVVHIEHRTVLLNSPDVTVGLTKWCVVMYMAGTSQHIEFLKYYRVISKALIPEPEAQDANLEKKSRRKFNVAAATIGSVTPSMHAAAHCGATALRVR